MRRETQDPYEVLGVARSASDEVIRAAWRAGVRRYHPDKAPDYLVSDYTERTRALNEARDLLTDERERREWDAAHPVPEPVPVVDYSRLGDALADAIMSAPPPPPQPLPVGPAARAVAWVGRAFVAWWLAWLVLSAAWAIASAVFG